MKASEKTRIGFHFVGSRLRYTNEVKPLVGEWRKLRGKRRISPCSYGFHASPTAGQAREYTPLGWTHLCLVLVRGNIHSRGDKFAGRERVIVAEVTREELKAKQQEISGQGYYASTTTAANEIFKTQIETLRALGHK